MAYVYVCVCVCVCVWVGVCVCGTCKGKFVTASKLFIALLPLQQQQQILIQTVDGKTSFVLHTTNTRDCCVHAIFYKYTYT